MIQINVNAFIHIKTKIINFITCPKRAKLLSTSRLIFGPLNDHKSRYNFRDCVSSVCDFGDDIETANHFFLRL